MTASHIQFQAAWLHTNSVNVNFKWSCSKGLHMNLLNCFYSLSKWTIKSCWKSHTCWLRLAFTTNEHSSRHILCFSIVMLLICLWFYPMLVPLLCIKDNSIGVILANHNQENWTRSTRSFSSHGLIIIPIIWSLILKANYIHFLFRKLPLQKNNSGIWHIYLLLTVPGHKFYLKNNILTISIHEKMHQRT